MNKRIQIILSDEASQVLTAVYAEAKKDFKLGNIKLSDLISEIIIQNKIDIKDVQKKCVNLKKSLKALAEDKDIDLQTAIKTLSELKNTYNKKSNKPQPPLENQNEV